MERVVEVESKSTGRSLLLLAFHYVTINALESVHTFVHSHDSKTPNPMSFPLLDKMKNSEESQKPTPAIPMMSPRPSILKLLVGGI